MNESKKQIWSVLGYLKESGVPCKVTLSCNDSSSYKYGHIDLNDLQHKGLMNLFGEIRKYYLGVKIGRQKFSFWNNQPNVNQINIDEIKKLIDEKSFEYVTNHKRKTRLDDILNDTSPLILI
jgi:hypothetical protein